MDVLSRYFCYYAVFTVGAVTATTATKVSTEAGEQAPVRASVARALVEWPADPAAGHDKVREVKPDDQHVSNSDRKRQQMNAAVATHSAPLTSTSSTECLDDATQLILQQSHCHKHQSKNFPTSQHRSGSSDLQQAWLQRQEQHSKERRRNRQGSGNKRQPVDFKRPERPAYRLLKRQAPRHMQTQEQKSHVSTRYLKPLGHHRGRKGGEERRSKEQPKLFEQASARQKQHELDVPHKLAGTSLLKLRGEEGREAKTQPPLSRVKQQQGAFALPHPHATSYQPPRLRPQGLRQPVGLQDTKIHGDSHHRHQFSAANVTKSLVGTRNLTQARRALQHIVQRQVLDFDAPAEQHTKQRVDEGSSKGQLVEPLSSTQDGTADVRGQEQNVLWGAGNPNVQLPQQVNLSQVLIQNSSQLFFNYDQPQQHGKSKKRGDGGSTDAGEYNWQQHVRGQPGRSGGEQQQREQEEEQKQLVQQQALLGELFALGHRVDEGQHLLKTYQDIRQQLQLLHLLQLHLVQQLAFLKQPVNHEKQHGQSGQQRHSRTQQNLPRQGVLLLPFAGPFQDTCATGNYPLMESFLQWIRAQKKTTRLLALSSNLALSARPAEAPASHSYTSNANLLNVKRNKLFLRLNASREPNVDAFSLLTDTGTSSQTGSAELAFKELPSSSRSETFTKELSRNIARGGDLSTAERLSQPQNMVSPEGQKPQHAERLRQQQQNTEQPLRHQMLPYVPRGTGHGRKQQACDNDEKRHAPDASVQAATTPLSLADVHRALLPSVDDPGDVSLAGALPPNANAKGAKLLLSPLQQETPASINLDYTGQEDRKAHAKRHHAPPRPAADVVGRCHTNTKLSARKGTVAPAGAADWSCQPKKNIATAGSVEEDGIAGTHWLKHEQNDVQQRLEAQVPSVTERSNVVYVFQGKSSPKVRDNERGQVTCTEDGVTSVKAEGLSDELAKSNHSTDSLTSDKKARLRKMIEDGIDPGRGDCVEGGTRQLPAAARSTTLPQGTRPNSKDPEESPSIAYGERKRPQGETQQHSGTDDFTIPANKQSDGVLHENAGADTSLKLDAKQDFDQARHIQLSKQMTASGVAQHLGHGSGKYQSKTDGRTIRQLRTQSQTESLAALICRVTQQKGELEHRKRSLQRQRERLYDMFRPSEVDKRRGHQRAHVNDNALPQEKEGEGQYVEKNAMEATTLLQQHCDRLLFHRSRKPGEPGTTYELSSASSSRALQMFSRSIFNALPAQSTISLCKTLGQPCAAGTICCEDLQCFISVNNSYTAPSLDGRGTCQPGGAATVPTSPFRLPIQMDPVMPQRNGTRRGRTNENTLFDVGGVTLDDEGAGGSPGQDIGVGGLPNTTGAGMLEKAELIRPTAPGSMESVLLNENILARNSGGARRVAGFARQYSLPSNSRELSNENIQSN